MTKVSTFSQHMFAAFLAVIVAIPTMYWMFGRVPHLVALSNTLVEKHHLHPAGVFTIDWVFLKTSNSCTFKSSRRLIDSTGRSFNIGVSITPQSNELGVINRTQTYEIPHHIAPGISVFAVHVEQSCNLLEAIRPIRITMPDILIHLNPGHEEGDIHPLPDQHESFNKLFETGDPENGDKNDIE